MALLVLAALALAMLAPMAVPAPQLVAMAPALAATAAHLPTHQLLQMAQGMQVAAQVPTAAVRRVPLRATAQAAAAPELAQAALAMVRRWRAVQVLATALVLHLLSLRS